MMVNRFAVLCFMLLIAIACNKDETPETPKTDLQFPTSRDIRLWPFAAASIWNMPIGAKAQYIPAQLEAPQAWGMTVDEDIIVLHPEAPLTEVVTNYAGWDRELDRCLEEGPLLFSAPIPTSFEVSPATWDGATPNSGLAVLMPDGRTVKQTQPFSRCSAGERATSRWVFEDADLYGQGYYGAHGGSGLSAIGGTLRVGELLPDAGPIRHVLKINIYGAKNLYYDELTKGYRWPALRADGYAPGNYGAKRNKTIVKECRMGALLALPAWMNLDSLQLETEPARRLARAFQTYGAYIVDDTAWDVYAIVTEWGPDGRVRDEFEAAWGFSMTPSAKNNSWARDMDRLFLNLHIVDNNTPNTIGGGGTPLAPLAPEPF